MLPACSIASSFLFSPQITLRCCVIRFTGPCQSQRSVIRCHSKISHHPNIPMANDFPAATSR
jgi:hypothetical protein